MAEPKLHPTLDGVELAITGKLASMSRAEAVARVEAAGGRYVSRPGRDTALLVVGQGGPPLGPDGGLTLSLERARELIEAGSNLHIGSEDEFLVRLGLEQADLQARVHHRPAGAHPRPAPQRDPRLGAPGVDRTVPGPGAGCTPSPSPRWPAPRPWPS